MKQISISNAVKIKNQRVKPFDGEKKYLATGGLVGDTIKTEVVTYKSKPTRADLLITENQLIVARMKGTNKVLLIDKNTSNLIVSTGFLVLEVQNCWHPRFLFHYLASSFFQKQKDRLSIGATQKAINNEKFKKIFIPEISYEDQKRIVKILDEANTLRQKRKQAINLLDDYVNSTFFNMFVNNREEKNISLVNLEKLTSKITDGVHAKPQYTESGAPFISVKNITTTKLKFEDCKFISLVDHQNFTKRCKAEFDDILYTKVGATYGRACIVDIKKEFSLYVSVALIKPRKDLVDPIFLKAVLNSSYVKRQADKSVKGAGVPDLHLIEIKKFKIPLPSMEEQKKFSKLVLKSEILKQKMLVQSEEMEKQFQALMQKSFILN